MVSAPTEWQQGRTSLALRTIGICPESIAITSSGTERQCWSRRCPRLRSVLPATPLAQVLGFAALPLPFFLILMGMVVVYLGLIEAAKARFYAHERNRPRRTPPSHEERHRRRLHCRASRFIARQVA
jgi:hypothetical protein